VNELLIPGEGGVGRQLRRCARVGAPSSGPRRRSRPPGRVWQCQCMAFASQGGDITFILAGEGGRVGRGKGGLGRWGVRPFGAGSRGCKNEANFGEEPAGGGGRRKELWRSGEAGFASWRDKLFPFVRVGEGKWVRSVNFQALDARGCGGLAWDADDWMDEGIMPRLYCSLGKKSGWRHGLIFSGG